jgi:hypothetical protein
MTYEGLLYHLLINNYSQEEFETLCLEFGYRYDHLEGNDFLKKARSFIYDLQRRPEKLDAFVEQAEKVWPNLEWRQPTAALHGSLSVQPSLQPPASGRGVLLDISHRQNEWRRSRNHTIFNQLHGMSSALGLNAGFITDPEQFCNAGLDAWQGLLMPMPWHELAMRDEVIDSIVRWVRNGGRIALFGFELGPRHHESGINRLAERFGLRFNSDIAVPDDYATRLQKNVANWLEAGETLPFADWSAGNKPYNNPVDYEVNEAAHTVLAGVRQLRWPSACTITAEPGSRVLVSLGRNWLGCMMESSAQYHPEHGVLQTGSDRFYFIPKLPWWPVAAAAPLDLVNNRGGAIAIGTWDVLSHVSTANQNELFVNNLLRWLAGETN